MAPSFRAKYRTLEGLDGYIPSETTIRSWLSLRLRSLTAADIIYPANYLATQASLEHLERPTPKRKRSTPWIFRKSCRISQQRKIGSLGRSKHSSNRPQ